MTADTPGTPAAETSAIDAEVDRMAEDAYGDSNYDDVVLSLRITKYAEASLSREVARLRAELAAAEQRGAESVAEWLRLLAEHDKAQGGCPDPDRWIARIAAVTRDAATARAAAADGGAS
jgi:hypothetical protein